MFCAIFKIIFTLIFAPLSKNISISRGNYFDQFIDSRMSEERLKYMSEVVNIGVRLLEKKKVRSKHF
ncbi:type II toxin-antitoxin system ParD family antitoxin [Maribacter sp. ACAM166]|uniref:type II toxin-antitoxin system ParD family antitoxin n=1 Tax=Maribacter sp. ACAM166 TaxID=2508996 RepID=UPI003977D832